VLAKSCVVTVDKTAITKAFVFDGSSLHRDLSVTTENDLITSISPSGDRFDAKVIDGTGMTLLPGLIDCHVHLGDDIGKASRLLFQLAKAGVTTALDLGHFTGPVQDSLRGSSGMADVRFTGTFATSTGSIHTRFPGISKASLFDNPQAAIRFVEDRVAEGADYIKIVADVPGLSQEIVNTLVIEARKRGMLTVAYAARNGALEMAQEGEVDIVTHVPLGFPLEDAATRLMKEEGRVCVPTLVMEEKIANGNVFPGLKYSAGKRVSHPNTQSWCAYSGRNRCESVTHGYGKAWRSSLSRVGTPRRCWIVERRGSESCNKLGSRMVSVGQ
jgi:imidazolonepropionase-like amidohydrolase